MQNLVELLQRANIPHTEVKIIPFVGELEEDINPEGPVVCMGAYSMRHLAKRKGWTPGVWDLEKHDYKVCKNEWWGHMLNHDATFCAFYDVLYLNAEDFDYQPVFIRPVTDSKVFAGGVMDRETLADLWHKIKHLTETGEVDPSGLTMHTEVMMTRPQKILCEVRNWVIDGKVVTSSIYKLGSRVVYKSDVDDDLIWFAQDRVNEWQPERAFVIDVALLENNEKKIVEINTLNAAGLYAADVNKLVGAIEAMPY